MSTATSLGPLLELMSSGYQPLAQSIEEADIAERVPTAEGVTRKKRGQSAPSGSIDLKKLDRAFKRWTESIAQRVKRKKKVSEHARVRIWRSVFDPAYVSPFAVAGEVKTLDHKPPMTKAEFENLVQSVKDAISDGIHPKMIAKGSSGSYFVRAKTDRGRVQTIAVFKPKDEEPYGRLNPKTMKWLHRQFRWIIPFGRACLIPNLSYISEAAASLLDERLHLHIVPPTQLVSLSSPAFFYDWLDRSAAKKGKPLPGKIGSMQFFLHGYQDASEFLRKHPWPGRAISDTFDDSSHRQGNISKKLLGALKILCGKTEDLDDLENTPYDVDHMLFDPTDEESERPFYWSPALQQNFREELEKLVILDYLMLNTDRGADNYMVKYCEGDHEKTLIDVAPARLFQLQVPTMKEPEAMNAQSRIASTSGMTDKQPSQPHEDYRKRPHIHIAAIDNSLSFPHEHPQGWRSYTYGWLYLPVSLIGRPFSDQTRNHFLPYLTSKTWWEETSFQLEKLFAVDPDFHPKMFKRQLAVIKGQAYNIVQSLKHNDEGPLELTRRQRFLVWDEETVIPDDASNNPPPSSPRPSVSSIPTPKRTRSSSVSDFPPPARRTSTDAAGLPRPVPFSAKFQRVHPGTTGVTVLEHLERLDAVEASLQRLGNVEVDVVDASLTPQDPSMPITSSSPGAGSPYSPHINPLTTVREVSSSASSIAEEDLDALSKSTPLLGRESRHEPLGDLEWMNDQGTRSNVVVERIELVKGKPFFAWW
ncbi:Phosphatidylinositol 3- and 4-kinase domain containing protein [Amanita muscaria]